MSRSKRVAFQLAHNAIDGEDDLATLRELYEEIQNAEEKMYSGLDDKALNLLAEVQPISISETNLSFQILSLMFLPDELEEAKKAMDEAKVWLSGSDQIWTARFKDYDEWMEAAEMTGSSYNISNASTAVSLMLLLFRKSIRALQDGWLEMDTKEAKHNNWVPIESVIETSKIPAQSLAVIRKAVERMEARGEDPQKEPLASLGVSCGGVSVRYEPGSAQAGCEAENADGNGG